MIASSPLQRKMWIVFISHAYWSKIPRSIGNTMLHQKALHPCSIHSCSLDSSRGQYLCWLYNSWYFLLHIFDGDDVQRSFHYISSKYQHPCQRPSSKMPPWYPPLRWIATRPFKVHKRRRYTQHRHIICCIWWHENTAQPPSTCRPWHRLPTPEWPQHV